MCATNAADSAAPTVRSTSRHAKVARRAAPAPQRDRARILRDVPVAPSDGIRRGGANRADGSALAPLRYASGSGRDAACLVLERRTVPCAACPRRRIPSTWSAVASSALSSSASVASPSRRISGPASSYSEWRATSCASGRRASPPRSDGNPGSWAPRLSRRPLIASGTSPQTIAARASLRRASALDSRSARAAARWAVYPACGGGDYMSGSPWATTMSQRSLRCTSTSAAAPQSCQRSRSANHADGGLADVRRVKPCRRAVLLDDALGQAACAAICTKQLPAHRLCARHVGQIVGDLGERQS
jgi:hypothetical protein